MLQNWYRGSIYVYRQAFEKLLDEFEWVYESGDEKDTEGMHFPQGFPDVSDESSSEDENADVPIVHDSDEDENADVPIVHDSDSDSDSSDSSNSSSADSGVDTN